MQNFSTLSKSRKCLICRLPYCNCEKCTKLRSTSKPDQSVRAQCSKLTSAYEYKPNQDFRRNTNEPILERVDASNKTTDKSKRFSIRKLFTLPSFSMPTFKFTPSNFESVLFDIVGVISFFIMASLMFWITISQYLWIYGKFILQSGRKIQLLALILIVLLCANITFHAIKGSHKQLPNIASVKETKRPLQPQESTTERGAPHCLHNSCPHGKCFNRRNANKINENREGSEIKPAASNCNLEKQKNPSLCDLCAKKFKVDSNSQRLLNDEEILEMFKRYKLYSVPSEMKFPPSFSNVIEVLAGFYNGIAGSLSNTFL